MRSTVEVNGALWQWIEDARAEIVRVEEAFEIHDPERRHALNLVTGRVAILMRIMGRIDAVVNMGLVGHDALARSHDARRRLEDRVMELRMAMQALMTLSESRVDGHSALVSAEARRAV